MPTRGGGAALGGTVAVVLCVLLAVSVPVLISYQRNARLQQPVTPATVALPASGEPAPGPQPPPNGAPPPVRDPAPTAGADAPPAHRASPPVPEAGSGRTRVAAFTRGAPVRHGRTVRVRLEVEQELPFDAEATARQAADVLQDNRSWTGRGAGVHFDFVGDAPADLTIRVLTPATTDHRCLPLKTGGRVSCQNGNGVNLNARRWAEGVPDFRGDVPLYRTYLVNHEVGHYLGHSHVECPAPGRPAPVMQQQTKGLDGCLANPWP